MRHAAGGETTGRASKCHCRASTVLPILGRAKRGKRSEKDTSTLADADGIYAQHKHASKLGESQSKPVTKPGTKMVYPEPCKELRRRPQLFLAGVVPYQPSSTRVLIVAQVPSQVHA